MLKAFSLVEVIISLIVCAILIGMVYAIVGILSGQLVVLEKENKLTSEYNRLHWSLQSAVYKSESLYFSEDRPVFIGIDKDTIAFVAGEDWVIRETSSFVDTFFVKGTRFELDTLRSPNGAKTMQRLNLFTVDGNRPDTLGFYKEIYPDRLFKKEKWQ